MKTRHLAAALAALLTTTLAAVAQGTTAFTYQGRLNVNGIPANGQFDLRFELFDVSTGGASRISPFVANAVAVSNGLFVAQIDFGQFAGEAYWIEIAARPGGSAASFNLLSPRQQLTPAPYASFAARAGAYEGPVGDFQLSPNVAVWGPDRSFPPVNFIAPTRPAAPPFTVNNSLLISNLNADRLDGLHASDFWKLNGNADTVAGAHYMGTSDNQPLELRANYQVGLRLEPGASAADLVAPGNLSFGAQTRQMLNLWGSDYGIGVQSDTVYFRTRPGDVFFGGGGNFSWFAGGQHSDTTFDPGLPRVLFDTARELMHLEGSGQLTVFGTSGNGVQGNSTGGASGVYGQNLSGGGFGIAGRTTGAGIAVYGDNTSPSGWAGRFDGNVSVSGNQSFGAQTRQMLNLWGTQYGIGVQSETLYFRTDGNALNGAFCWYKGGAHSDTSRDAGGGAKLMCLSDIFLLLYVDLQSTASCSFAGDGYFGRDVSCRTLTQRSDRASKENFAPVNGPDVLEKVSALPLTSWNFKDAPAVRHIGPMAQDFYATFGVGPDDTHIATVDADGVALAAIQGLNQKVESLNAELKRRDAENAELKQKNAEMEARLDALEKLCRVLSP